MLMNLNKKSWVDGLSLKDYNNHCSLNQVSNGRTFRYGEELLSIQCLILTLQDTVKEMLNLAKNYDKALEEEDKMTPEQLAIKNVGKQDPKRHLEDKVDVLMTTNIVQCLGAMLDAVVFKWGLHGPRLMNMSDGTIDWKILSLTALFWIKEKMCTTFW